MAASYPGGFDTMSDPAANLSGPPLHSTMHNQINDVIEAIEAELGLNPSGADATVAATLAALPSRYVAVPTAWTAVTFTGTWVNYGAPYQVCQYRKTGDVVEVRGLIKSGTTGTSAFTLPAGFRPPADYVLPTNAAGAYASLTVTAAGTVTPSAASTASVNVTFSFSVTA